MDTGENMNTGLRCFLTPTVCPTIQFYCDANYLGLASDSTGFKGWGPSLTYNLCLKDGLEAPIRNTGSPGYLHFWLDYRFEGTNNQPTLNRTEVGKLATITHKTQENAMPLQFIIKD